MKKITILFFFIFLFSGCSFSQTLEYQTQKAENLATKSPFEKIIDRELPATIEYEDEDIIAFIPLRKQAPVHILIVPKKRILTTNEITPEDEPLIGRMFSVARKLAQEKGIAETGYRISFNTNEDAGQSVFHIHMHLIGGKALGPMVNQDYKEK